MADLTPNDTWDNVYQIETGDPVIGGAGGLSNTPHQQLLNRTQYLFNVMGLSTNTIYVDPAAGAGGDGSVGSPYQYIIDAVNHIKALKTLNIIIIQLADGTHRMTEKIDLSHPMLSQTFIVGSYSNPANVTLSWDWNDWGGTSGDVTGQGFTITGYNISNTNIISTFGGFKSFNVKASPNTAFTDDLFELTGVSVYSIDDIDVVDNAVPNSGFQHIVNAQVSDIHTININDGNNCSLVFNIIDSNVKMINLGCRMLTPDTAIQQLIHLTRSKVGYFYIDAMGYSPVFTSSVDSNKFVSVDEGSYLNLQLSGSATFINFRSIFSVDNNSKMDVYLENDIFINTSSSSTEYLFTSSRQSELNIKMYAGSSTSGRTINVGSAGFTMLFYAFQNSKINIITTLNFYWHVEIEQQDYSSLIYANTNSEIKITNMDLVDKVSYGDGAYPIRAHNNSKIILISSRNLKFNSINWMGCIYATGSSEIYITTDLLELIHNNASTARAAIQITESSKLKIDTNALDITCEHIGAGAIISDNLSNIEIEGPNNVNLTGNASRSDCAIRCSDFSVIKISLGSKLVAFTNFTTCMISTSRSQIYISNTSTTNIGNVKSPVDNNNFLFDGNLIIN